MRDQDNLIIMEKLDSLPSETHIDVLIMAASVDKRCYAVFEKFLTNCTIAATNQQTHKPSAT